MGNSPGAYPACPGQSKFPVQRQTFAVDDEDAIDDFEMQYEVRPGRYTLSDYSFETPATDLQVNVSSTVKVPGNDAFEIYDYPGEYEKKDLGEKLAKIRMEEEECLYQVVTGSGIGRAFASGHKFSLKEHFRSDLNTNYVLTEVHHSATVGDTYVNTDRQGEENYLNRFGCIPITVPYRPPRVTPKPTIHGSQTAVVVGKKKGKRSGLISTVE